MKYLLPTLPYAYSALEPYIDARTMEIHHTKHHQTYIDKLNAALEKYPELQERPLEDLLRNLSSLKVDEKDRTVIRNHGGGHINHSFFWQIMGPHKESNEDLPQGELLQAINKTFGGFNEFKAQFSNTAVTHFGSGWAWLVKDVSDALKVYSLSNQDSPYLQNHIPIIGLDVWEHAYYIKFLWNRAEYIESWWNVINWRRIEEIYIKDPKDWF